MTILSETNERVYTPKETSEITEIDKETLRKWSEHFNIQTSWTQADRKGHRRYTKKNIEELQAIKDKIKNQRWTWDQVLQWRNGEEDMFVTHQEKSNLEKKMDQLLDQQLQTNQSLEMQQQFNQVLIDQLKKSEQNSTEFKKLVLESKQELEDLKQIIQEQQKQLLENKSTIQKPQKRKKILGMF